MISLYYIMTIITLLQLQNCIALNTYYHTHIHRYMYRLVTSVSVHMRVSF